MPHDSVRGAVRAVDVRARTLEVTTGVGFALRVVRLQVPAGVPITNQQRGQREPIRLGELKPGDVIRASFGGRPTGFVAYTIERLGRMNAGVDAKRHRSDRRPPGGLEEPRVRVRPIAVGSPP